MGPLQGYRIIELAGIGPSPMAGMMLADMGAEVIRVERTTRRPPEHRTDISFRGKRSIALDLKLPEGANALLRLLDDADALIEGFRPGVAERLGIGPEVCLKRNPKLIYGRVTGWGQDGPLANAAGHDINYIAITGALHAIGRPNERPVPPLNLVGDMGGGGMLLAYGVVCGLLEAQRSGLGQIVDAAMVDGAAQLMWMMHSLDAAGRWNAEERGVNLLDGGAHFYDAFETSDGKFVAIGSIEPQFYAQLIALIGADREHFDEQLDQSRWPDLQAELAAIFRTKTRDQWCRILEGTDACFAPVLTLREAPNHAHNRARKSYVTLDGIVQPAPAPRFSRTVAEIRCGARAAGAEGEALLTGAGFTADEILALSRSGALIPPASGAS
jgi:alpha-methylacyl-CoA racemase